MAKRIPTKLAPWFEAQRRFRLSDIHVQMARELGLNPKKFGRYAGSRHDQPWKKPLPEFIERIYERQFGRVVPPKVVPLEEQAREHCGRMKARRKRRARAKSRNASK